MTGEIHDEHPFRGGQRDPVRQLRGRLAAPVTVVTAGDAVARAGLTVSSLITTEGNQGGVHFLVGQTTDLFHQLVVTRRFVVHILEEHHRALSDVFAGTRPSPGGVFAGQSVSPSDWGPVLDDVPNRAYCTYLGGEEAGFSFLAAGTVDRVVIGDLERPLVYFRGGYRTLSDPASP